MPVNIILILLAALFAFITWRDLRAGLFLILAFLPSYLLRFSVFGIPGTFLEVMILLMFLIWLLQRGYRSHPLRDEHAWIVFLLFTVLTASVAALVSPDIFAALGVWKSYFIEPILLFIVFTSVIKKSDDVWPFLTALAAGSWLIILPGIAQYAFDFGIPAPWDVERRITSIFPYPNAVGLFLGPMVVMSFFSLTQKHIRKNRRMTIFWTATGIFSLFSVILAQSEAAIAAIVATLFLSALFFARSRRVAIVCALLAIFAIGLFQNIREPIIQKLTLRDFSGQVRISQWKESAELLKDKPVFGAGLSGYPTAIIPYHSEKSYEIFQYPHNIFLNTWVELGLLGIITLGFAGALVIKTFWRTRKKEPIIFLASGVLLEMTIHGLVDVPYFKNDLSVLTWFFIAAIFVTHATYASRAH